MNRDQIICPCLDITAGQIMDAYKEGAKSVEAIKEVTGAGTACGACLDEIEELIDNRGNLLELIDRKASEIMLDATIDLKEAGLYTD